MGVKSSALKLLFCMVGLWTTVLWAQPEVTHKVQRKETAFGIARKYGVDVNALFELNRWAESGIRKGDVLRIPKATEPEIPAPSAKPAVHLEGGVAREVVPDVESSQVSPEFDPEKNQAEPRLRPVPATWPVDTLKIAVMLPFSSGEDSLDRQALRLREIAMDCMAGVRLALDTGRWLGAHCDVRFLDSGLDTSGQLKCMPEDVFFAERPADIVVGPLRRSSFKKVRTWPGVQGAVHLAITDLGAQLVRKAPGLLFPFVQPSNKMEALAALVHQRHRGERVMMLSSGDIRNIHAEDGLRQGWIDCEADSLTAFVEVEVSSRGLGSLRDSLSDVRRNVLVAPGGKASRSFAGVLQTEIQLGDTMDFVLYTDGSWRDFEFLDPAFCERVQLTVVDGGGARPDSISEGWMSDSAYAGLARQLVLLRGTAPTKYAWLTHDLLREAVGWTAGHGRDWPERIAAGEFLLRPLGVQDGHHHPFRWEATFGPGSGLVNGYVRLLQQKDMRWVQLERQSAKADKTEPQAP